MSYGYGFHQSRIQAFMHFGYQDHQFYISSLFIYFSTMFKHGSWIYYELSILIELSLRAHLVTIIIKEVEVRTHISYLTILLYIFRLYYRLDTLLLLFNKLNTYHNQLFNTILIILIILVKKKNTILIINIFSYLW